MKQVVTGGAGMDDPATGVDKKCAGAENIQRFGKGRRFRLLEVYRLADEQCAARMRCNKRQAPAQFVVDHAAFLSWVRDKEDGMIRV